MIWFCYPSSWQVRSPTGGAFLPGLWRVSCGCRLCLCGGLVGWG